MAAKHGIDTSTYERVQLGPGAVYIGDNILGATKGGNTFEIIRVFRDIRPDGARGKVKNFRHLDSVEAILTVNLLEIDESILTYLIAGSSLATPILTGGAIVAATYISEVSLVVEVRGVTTGATEINAIEYKLTNALVEGPFTITTPVEGEVVMQVKFHAHFDPSALTTEPWAITTTHVA